MEEEVEEKASGGIIARETSLTTTGIKEEEKEEVEATGKSRAERKTRKIKRNHRRNRVISASNKNVTIEPISEMTSHLNLINRNYLFNNDENLQREERLRMRKFYLRHLVNRQVGLREIRKESLERSKHEFVRARKLLKEMNREKEEM